MNAVTKTSEYPPFCREDAGFASALSRTEADLTAAVTVISKPPLDPHVQVGGQKVETRYVELTCTVQLPVSDTWVASFCKNTVQMTFICELGHNFKEMNKQDKWLLVHIFIVLENPPLSLLQQ